MKRKLKKSAFTYLLNNEKLLALLNYNIREVFELYVSLSRNVAQKVCIKNTSHSLAHKNVNYKIIKKVNKHIKST